MLTCNCFLSGFYLEISNLGVDAAGHCFVVKESSVPSGKKSNSTLRPSFGSPEGC